MASAGKEAQRRHGMHRMLFIGALAWMPVAAPAQQVYKCVSAGQVSYQSSPCAGDSELAGIWDHGEYAPPTPQRLPMGDAGRPVRGSSTREGYNHRATASRHIDSSTAADRRCETARRRRETILRNESIGKRSMELRRRLDREVAEACRY